MKNAVFIGIVFLSCSFMNNKSTHNQAEVNQVNGLYLFVDSKPVSEFEYLGTCKNRVALNVQYQSVRDKLIRKVKKEYPNANGVIFHFHDGGTDLADAILIK